MLISIPNDDTPHYTISSTIIFDTIVDRRGRSPAKTESIAQILLKDIRDAVLTEIYGKYGPLLCSDPTTGEIVVRGGFATVEFSVRAVDDAARYDVAQIILDQVKQRDLQEANVFMEQRRYYTLKELDV